MNAVGEVRRLTASRRYYGNNKVPEKISEQELNFALVEYFIMKKNKNV